MFLLHFTVQYQGTVYVQPNTKKKSDFKVLLFVVLLFIFYNCLTLSLQLSDNHVEMSVIQRLEKGILSRSPGQYVPGKWEWDIDFDLWPFQLLLQLTITLKIITILLLCQFSRPHLKNLTVPYPTWQSTSLSVCRLTCSRRVFLGYLKVEWEAEPSPFRPLLCWTSSQFGIRKHTPSTFS